VKPVDDTFIEAFNGTLRRQCLSLHWFLGLEDLQRTLEAWRDDYNNCRAHSSLADIPPADFSSGLWAAASSIFRPPSGLKSGRGAPRELGRATG